MAPIPGLKRPVPQWFRDAPLGIFIHWGAYSVPAWAEPIGALGTISDMRHWFTHNPYAEWYANTIRIPDSPAAAHHRAIHGGADYDDFLDQWHAEHFDPDDLMDLFARAGAGYVIPVTKHHDGITLWDAPGTGTRNTVHRGPQRDLVGQMKEACDRAGLRFGVYYSGGLDWHVRDLGPILPDDESLDPVRPKDASYGDYCTAHVRDLIGRYEPVVLWNDIGWPDASVQSGQLAHLLRDYYAAVPDGLVNDRFNGVHWDYRTTEYAANSALETADGHWENCRGLGFSFGFNQVEDEAHTLTGQGIAELLVDIVSRGGHLLLNVGPRADGTLPPVQRRALEDLATWMPYARAHLLGATPTHLSASDAPWQRFVATADGAIVGCGRDLSTLTAAGPGTPTVVHDGSGAVGVAIVRFD